MTFPWITKARLWLVLDRHAAHPRTLADVTTQAIAGGVDAVLCRIKDLPEGEAGKLARDVRSVCRRLDTPFVMSHSIKLAMELHADGVQLGVGDPSIMDVRQDVGLAMAIGYSTHGVEEALQRLGDGADYVFLGPIFATPEKLKYGDPLGLQAVRKAIQTLPDTVVFIGGIAYHNVDDVLANGGRRIAAISALQRVGDPQAAALELAARLREYSDVD